MKTTREFLRDNQKKYSNNTELVKACTEELKITSKHIKRILREEAGVSIQEETQGNPYNEYNNISTIPKTVDEHAKAIGVDLDMYEIYFTKENFWGSESDPHYQTKFSRRIKHSWVARDIAKTLREEFKKSPFVHKPSKVFYNTNNKHNCLELSLIDPHVGDISYEYPDPYSSLKRFQDTFMEFLNLNSIFDISEIVIPLGHDFFNVDNISLETTNGTQQSEYPLRYNVYAKSVNVLIRLILEAREVAPVKVFMVPGNHDQETNFFLGHVLRLFFEKYKEITIYDGYNEEEDKYQFEPYKFYKFGKNLLGFTHGKEIALNRLPLLMATESGSKWANTIYREWHLGHLHHLSTQNFLTMDEHAGIRLRWLPSMIMRSNWSKLKGYSAIAEGLAIIWNYENGNVATFKKRFLRKYK